MAVSRIMTTNISRNRKERLTAPPDDDPVYRSYLRYLDLTGRNELRTVQLDDRKHRGYLWRSDMSKTLYRYCGGWQLFIDGRWQQCMSDYRSHLYDLNACWGEVFIRVAKDLDDPRWQRNT